MKKKFGEDIGLKTEIFGQEKKYEKIENDRLFISYFDLSNLFIYRTFVLLVNLTRPVCLKPTHFTKKI